VLELFNNKKSVPKECDYTLDTITFVYICSSLIYIYVSKRSKINEKNTTKFSPDSTNFNERTNRDYNNTLNQQQDIINKTLDNTLDNIKRTTDEATREIPKYTQRIAEYQEQTIQTVKDIASDFLKQKEK